VIPLLLLASTAWAQSNSSPNCGAGAVFPSAQRDLLQRAATDNTNLYGAVGTAERVVLPAMHKHEGMKLLVFESHVLAGALHVPARAMGDCEDSMLRAPVDLTASNWALAWSNGDVGIFYNASVTTAYPQGSGSQRAVIDTVNTMAGIYYGLAAPFMPAGGKVTEDGTVNWDYIIGGEFTPGTVAVRAGYVGSKGAYFQAAEKKSGAFFGAAANESFAQIPYLRGGIEHLTLPATVEKIGRSSLFGRKLELPGVVGAEDGEPADLVTGHVAQEGLFRVVDVWATYAAKPTPFLHELRVGGHTPNFLGIDDGDEGWGVRGVVGFVTMPERIDLDVVGGRRFSGALEAGYRSESRADYARIDLHLRYNDPQVLALFPYAEDAMDIYFLLSFGQVD
jgi:hypothetical protein